MKLTKAKTNILEKYSESGCDHDQVNGRMIKSVRKLEKLGLVERDSSGWGFKVTEKGRDTVKLIEK